jgi:hypothetical protein
LYSREDLYLLLYELQGSQGAAPGFRAKGIAMADCNISSVALIIIVSVNATSLSTRN